MTREFRAGRLSQYFKVSFKIALPDSQVFFICEPAAVGCDAPPGYKCTPQRQHKICQGVKPLDFRARQSIIQLKFIFLKWSGDGSLDLKLHIIGLQARL